jgi:hypothetical protein
MKTLWFIHLDEGRNIIGPFASNDEATGVAKVLTLRDHSRWEIHPVLLSESE